ncbi:MAG: ABC transporter permease [Microthrixaceae bacterium]
MFRYALKSLRANLTRLVATALAVVIGITFLASGLMLTDAMRSGLTADVEAQYAETDLAILPSETSDFGGGAALASIPPEVLDSVRATDGVAAATGEIQAAATVRRPDGATANLRSQGRSWIEDDALNPVQLLDGRAPEGADEVVLDEELADDARAEIDDRVELETPIGPLEVTVVGISAFGDSGSLDGGGTIWMDEATATEVLNAGVPGYSTVVVRTDGDPATVASTLRQELPASVQLLTRDEFIEDRTAFAAAIVSVLRPVLQGFAYLSMFVCAFVIFNTFSVVVTQRFRELALIRSVGGTPAQVRRSLILEGLVIGLVSSAIGIVGGLALTVGVQQVLDRFDLGLPQGSLQVTFGTVLVCMLVGTIVTTLSVIVPAFRAGRTKPVEAMRASAVDSSGTSTVRAVAGAILLALSLLLLGLNQFTSPKWYYLAPGGLLLFLSLFVAGPLLARGFALVVTPLLARVGMSGRLAGDNSIRNPRRTATTANALVIGLFLVTLVTVSGEAMKTYIVGEINKLSSSDFVVAAERSLDPAAVEEIRATDGVTGAAPLRFGQVSSSQSSMPFIITTTDDPGALGEVAGMAVKEGSLDEVIAGDGVAVPDLGELGGSGTGQPIVGLGEQVQVTDLSGEQRTLTVEAILDDGGVNGLLVGYLVGEQTFTELAGDQPIGMAFVRAEPGQADDVGRRIEQVLDGYAGVEILAGNFISDAIVTVFDFLIGAVNALLGMSVVVALVGIVNTMTLAIFERRRELGMVRALGMTGQQVGRMIRMEAVLIGLLGTLIGIGAGVLLSWVVVSSIEEIEIGLSFNWARVGLIFAVGIAVGVIASLLPARRATRLDMLEAMRSE